MQTNINTEIEEAEKAIKIAEEKYGSESLAVAEAMRKYAQLLKANKVKLLEAANLETYSKRIMDKLITKNSACTGSRKPCPYCAEMVK